MIVTLLLTLSFGVIGIYGFGNHQCVLKQPTKFSHALNSSTAIRPGSKNKSIFVPLKSPAEKHEQKVRPFTTTKTTNSIDETNHIQVSVIRRLDRKIQKCRAKEQKYLEKLNQATYDLEKYQNAKQRYLDGALLGDGLPGVNSFSETPIRSIIKSFMWRLIAGSVTFLTSLRFSGSISTAISIVGSDFFSKSATMFVGERLMNKSQAGRNGGSDDVGRSLAKALIWRLFAICNTMCMSLLIAKNISMASKIAGSDAVFKTGLMFLYERVWAKIEWGKSYNSEFAI
mmetsp:Transcript_1172/g.2212  ORF Transcript_1172/g.2212 Transcript_1172/m.2212 type:complete len:285 (+) Transcript_1172:197-1051(+)